MWYLYKGTSERRAQVADQNSGTLDDAVAPSVYVPPLQPVSPQNILIGQIEDRESSTSDSEVDGDALPSPGESDSDSSNNNLIHD